MQPLITMYENGRLDKWEILFSRYGAYSAFRNEIDKPGNIISPKKRKDLENSWGNTVPIIVVNGDEVVIGDSYSCVIPDYENTSAKVTPTFAPFAWGWKMYPGQYRTGSQAMNYVDYDNDFMKKADKYMLALMDSVDVASRDILETEKNIYWPPNIANYYAVVGDSLQIPQSAKNDAFNQLAAVMQELDLYDQNLVIGSTSLKPLTTRLQAQGEGNAVNERFQFQLGNFVYTGSNRITNGVGMQSTFYMCQPGSIAVFNRNAPDFRNKERIGGTGGRPVREWNTLWLPQLMMEVGTYYTADCASDPAATNYLTPNLSATLAEGYGFNTEIGWLTAYNSDPSNKVKPIVKAEISVS